MRGKKQSPAKEEQVYATYIATGSYQDTAEKHGMPKSTVFGIVQRVGGDGLEQHRTAMRADIARRIWDKVAVLADAVNLNELGTEKSSRGFEAARAAESLSRVAAALEPKDKDRGEMPVAVTVAFGFTPPGVVPSPSMHLPPNAGIPSPRLPPKRE